MCGDGLYRRGKGVEGMAAVFPFLTTYDPLGTSEGSLDPLGLYQIADQLAIQLVPAVRERMQRIRFLTTMAVGALVIEDLESDPRHRDASPYLVWEWLVVEALTRNMADTGSVRGVPGTGVTRTALAQHGYVDGRSYLKTPRVFGFHGVYKRLAVRLELVDVHLGPGPNAERLVDAWAQGQGLKGVVDAKPLLERWRGAVRRSLNHTPPRTNARWNTSEWREFARAFAPNAARVKEKELLSKLLLSSDDRQLGALPELWQLQAEFGDEALREEKLHADLQQHAPAFGALVEAIRTYESFARGLPSERLSARRTFCSRTSGAGGDYGHCLLAPESVRRTVRRVGGADGCADLRACAVRASRVDSAGEVCAGQEVLV